MGVTTSIMKEQELNEFRKLNPDSNTDVDLPTPPENRKVTDKKGFVIFGILMLVLVPFLIYTLVKSDIRRLHYGHDNCGNLCGVKNTKIDGINCSGKDYTDKPYETINIRTNERRCTDKCPPGYAKDDKTCYGDDEGTVTDLEIIEFWADILGLWWKYLIITLITTILCLLTLLLFRYCPGVIVWGVSILSIIMALALTSFFWYAYSQWEDKEGSKQAFLACAVLLTLFTVVIIIMFLFLFKKIKLIIMLYKEATKALFDMPALIFFPVLTLLLQLLALSLMVFTTTYMGTSAELEETNGNFFYERNGVMQFTIIFNIIVTIWSLQFFSGWQYMIVSGSVAQWFFKKNLLYSPIFISFTNTMRFHLGTVALGSFIITLVAVIKALIKSLIANARLRWLVECCCGQIEAFLKFLSKNAYIETAIWGQSFFRSGRRAAKLLITNAGSVIAINSVGDFVLAMTQFLLLAASTAIAYGIFLNEKYSWLPTILAFLLNLVVVVIVFNVFETIVDTLFVCFCEDTIINDGSPEKPYYMTTGLKQFVDKSEELYKKK